MSERTWALTAPNWATVIDRRPQLTAKALRALGRPVPACIDDHEVIELVERPSA